MRKIEELIGILKPCSTLSDVVFQLSIIVGSGQLFLLTDEDIEQLERTVQHKLYSIIVMENSAITEEMIEYHHFTRSEEYRRLPGAERLKRLIDKVYEQRGDT